jgi:hypothetical protein
MLRKLWNRITNLFKHKDIIVEIAKEVKENEGAPEAVKLECSGPAVAFQIDRPDLYPKVVKIDEIPTKNHPTKKIGIYKYEDGSEIRVSNDRCSHCATKKLIDRLEEKQEKVYSNECYSK